MPLYEYECDNGHRFEKIQKFSDPPLDACERCGAPAHKLMSSPAIQFKGTGWYITDYARKDSSPAKDAKAGSTDSKETKSSDSSSSSEGSSKPAETKSDTSTSAKTDKA